MKKTFYTLLLLFPLWGLGGFLVSCNNDDDNSPPDPVDQLPPATQTGENTLGYLLNGVPVSINNSGEIGAFYQQLQLQIGGDFQNNNLDTSIILLANGPLEENVSYELINNSIFVNTVESQTCFYDIEDTYEGSIVFTNIDETNFIISGIFEFSTVTEGCDVINVTEGRFDVNYAP